MSDNTLSCHTETLSLLRFLMPLLDGVEMDLNQQLAYDRLAARITDWGFENAE